METFLLLIYLISLLSDQFVASIAQFYIAQSLLKRR